MSTTTDHTSNHPMMEERAAERLARAEVLDRHRPAAGSSIDPARMADYERREAAADLAGSDEAAAIARGHRAPG